MSRSRITIGVLTGVAVVAVAAVPSLASSSGEPASTPLAATSSAAAASTAAGKVAAAAVTAKASITAKATTAKTVRSVKLVIPVTTNKVGTNVTGYIQVTDTTGSAIAPGADAEVGLQQLRGKAYVEIASGTTDASGRYAISFTSATNTSLRAVLKPATGKPVYGATVATKAIAHVTWAARPIMTTGPKTAVSYSFRVDPESGTGRLEIANAKSPTKWISTKAVAVPRDGVLKLSVTFPSAGNWLVRGATVPNTLNAAGYTSTLPVVVG